MPCQVAEGGRKVNYISKELYAKVVLIQTFCKGQHTMKFC
ncbi:hypothetical protein Hsw_2875 [Hymenobacter swuensis DY53]|uniref:Uncharacterized protein n=1 Tax=Hymenobacter swuensis DY53 TaxID=1227739 RepID=W8F9W0_9BACT|nr:hypothetical protein Hsw_2875 [Hymenobacter swuensis DY53]